MFVLDLDFEARMKDYKFLADKFTLSADEKRELSLSLYDISINLLMFVTLYNLRLQADQ